MKQSGTQHKELETIQSFESVQLLIVCEENLRQLIKALKFDVDVHSVGIVLGNFSKYATKIQNICKCPLISIILVHDTLGQ